MATCFFFIKKLDNVNFFVLDEKIIFERPELIDCCVSALGRSAMIAEKAARPSSTVSQVAFSPGVWRHAEYPQRLCLERTCGEADDFLPQTTTRWTGIFYA